MKKFFDSAKTLFLLLLLLNKVLPLTATTNEITIVLNLFNKKEQKKHTRTYYHDLKLNKTNTQVLKVSVDLTNDKHYFNQVLKVLKEQYPNHHFLFPWGLHSAIFELPALAASSFPITKQCPEDLLIYAVKEDLFDEKLTRDPVTFFQKPKNWHKEWGEPKVGSATTSTISKNEGGLPSTTTSDRAGTDSHTNTRSDISSGTGKSEQKKGGALLKYGGVLLLVSILTGGCYALYRSVTSQKGRRPEQEEEQEEEAARYL